MVLTLFPPRFKENHNKSLIVAFRPFDFGAVLTYELIYYRVSVGEFLLQFLNNSLALGLLFIRTGLLRDLGPMQLRLQNCTVLAFGLSALHSCIDRVLGFRLRGFVAQRAKSWGVKTLLRFVPKPQTPKA